MDVSWELIDAGLKILFSRNNIETRDLDKTHRLEYTDMEYILYHLFMIIDARTSRKSLSSIYPARNQDDKTRFINNMVMMINKQLPREKISASRLRMCGGQPFRVLISSLIKEACHVDMLTRMKRTGLPQPSDIDLHISETRLVREKEILDKEIAELEDMRMKLQDLRMSQRQIRCSKQVSWDELQNSINSSVEKEFDKQDLKRVQRLLMVVLGKTTEGCVSSMNKIAAIQLSEPRDEPKRLSYYVRELQAHVNSSNSSHSTIDDYDTAMENLIIRLEEKQRRCDERLLQDPKILERYNRLAKIIPFVRVRPIRV